MRTQIKNRGPASAEEILGRDPRPAHRADRCRKCDGRGYQYGLSQGAVFTCPECEGAGVRLSTPDSRPSTRS